MRETLDTSARSASVSGAEPGLFVHIKKTAGISIRDALAESHEVIADYGLAGPKTSEIIKRYKYKQPNPYALRCEVRRTGAWLTGHFQLLEFADFVDCRRIITFVRHPVDRVISHFNHARAYLYAGARIETFVCKKKTRNEQHRVLQGIPLGCIGFVGVAEKFSESLEMINAGLNLDLSLKYANVNQHKTIERDEVSEEIRELIVSHNRRDMALYQRALTQHELRYRHFLEGKPWCHGYYIFTADGRVEGSAFYAGSDDAVEVDVLRRGEQLARLPAIQFQTREVKSLLPRDRYVAFKAQLSPPFDDVEVVVAATGQKLERLVIA